LELPSHRWGGGVKTIIREGAYFMSISLISYQSTPMVSSKEVAKKFGKRHTEVLRAYRQLAEHLNNEEFLRRNFASAVQKSGNKEIFEEVMMTKTGFTMLAMRFTGGEAAKWQLLFIYAFERMEKHIPELEKKIEEQKVVISQLSSGMLHLPKESMKGKMVTIYEPMFPGEEPKIKVTMVLKESLEPKEQIDGLHALNILSTEGNRQRTELLKQAIAFIDLDPIERIKRWLQLPKRLKKVIEATGLKF
jgi:Rha family phage regulatory protein